MYYFYFYRNSTVYVSPQWKGKEGLSPNCNIVSLECVVGVIKKELHFQPDKLEIMVKFRILISEKNYLMPNIIISVHQLSKYNSDLIKIFVVTNIPIKSRCPSSIRPRYYRMRIIYHDFLPPPRRGSHVKSDNTHTSINIHA